MRLLPALVALVVLLVALPAAQSSAVDQVRDRLDAYLIAYERELGALVATEKMTQLVERRFTETGASLAPERKRTSVSEVAFVGLPGDTGLMGFRRVLELDGERIEAPGEPMATLLQSAPAPEVTKRMLQETGRYNLGQTRNLNLPSLPLELLHPRNRRRFAHQIKGRDTVRGSGVTLLTAEETARPSIIQMSPGGSSPSVVTAWIDATGQLLRAEVRLRHPSVSGVNNTPTIRVEFEPHESLGLLVPTTLRETFWSDQDRRDGQSVARYSDFRRFQTSARIVPPPP